MSEDEEIKENPIEILNPDWEMRCIVPIDSPQPNKTGVVNGPLIIANENRFNSPLSLNNEKLAAAAGIEESKHGFCKRAGEDIVWVEPSRMDKFGPQALSLATRDEFTQALVNGIIVINPS